MMRGNTNSDHKTSVALVTGAARGIGRALTEALAARDFSVIALVRTPKDAAELSQLAKVQPVCCDITESSCEKILKEFTEARVSKIDLLINNAGYGASAYGIEALKFEELDRVLAVHCHGPIRCIKACLPLLKRSNNARILNISSRFASIERVSNKTVPAEQATYAYRIAKASMNMLSACLAVELEESKIRVMSIDPGKVKTRFGPIDADTEAPEAALSILQLAESYTETGKFINTAGETIPW